MLVLALVVQEEEGQRMAAVRVDAWHELMKASVKCSAWCLFWNVVVRYVRLKIRGENCRNIREVLGVSLTHKLC